MMMMMMAMMVIMIIMIMNSIRLPLFLPEQLNHRHGVDTYNHKPGQSDQTMYQFFPCHRVHDLSYSLARQHTEAETRLETAGGQVNMDHESCMDPCERDTILLFMQIAWGILLEGSPARPNVLW